MSWAATTLVLLGVVLASGIGWYERSRPPAKMIAVVAALAALAVAGRLVFAAIPNVVATTDIVLISGYALGAAPGFAVGALAAAVSNIWLGQGAWTPWEMAGWGLVGVGGAALAAITVRRLGRAGLAVACGVAGLAYGALLDLSVMVTYGGEQSLDRYLAISARGVPFNVAHAAGNVALALAAGPALTRIILRYRRRFEFRWRGAPESSRPLPGVAAGPLALVVALLLALASVPLADAAGDGTVSWLERAQNDDGGFGAEPGSRSSPEMTGWAMLALEAAGVNPRDVREGGPSPVAYLRANADRVRTTGDLERTVLALVGAGVSPRRFAGHDLVEELRRRRDRDGSFDGQVNLTSFGILALRAADAPAASVRRPALWLKRKRNADGGWGFQPSAPSDPDSTGAALQALAAVSGSSPAIAAGTRYLRRVQGRDGGFALAGSGPSNAQSTAWAVQGLLAAGANPARVRAGGRSPLDYLAARRRADGHYSYSATSDQTPVWVTSQVLLAVERRVLPLAAVPRAERPRGSPPAKSSSQVGPAPASVPQPAPPASGAGARPSTPKGGDHGEQARRNAPSSGASSRLATAGGSSPDVAAAERAASGMADETGDQARYVIGGLTALAAALTGGFFWYRRRLP